MPMRWITDTTRITPPALNISIAMPADTLEVLEVVFGPDWQTPQSDHSHVFRTVCTQSPEPVEPEPAEPEPEPTPAGRPAVWFFWFCLLALLAAFCWRRERLRIAITRFTRTRLGHLFALLRFRSRKAHGDTDMVDAAPLV